MCVRCEKAVFLEPIDTKASSGFKIPSRADCVHYIHYECVGCFACNERHLARKAGDADKESLAKALRFCGPLLAEIDRHSDEENASYAARRPLARDCVVEYGGKQAIFVDSRAALAEVARKKRAEEAEQKKKKAIADAEAAAAAAKRRSAIGDRRSRTEYSDDDDDGDDD